MYQTGDGASSQQVAVVVTERCWTSDVDAAVGQQRVKVLAGYNLSLQEYSFANTPMRYTCNNVSDHIKYNTILAPTMCA